MEALVILLFLLLMSFLLAGARRSGSDVSSDGG